MVKPAFDMTIQGLLQHYRQGDFTPEHCIEQLLTQAASYPEHNIWITLLSREQMAPYLARLKDYSPDALPLYGIPFAIKDNIDLADVPTTAACEAFRYTPSESAFVVQRLIEAGAIPIGKTNLDQFATGLVGTRSPWGAVKNAFDGDYISGGSSSGSAVANALGLVSFALGTDTAGSGRVPAAFNNLIGVKPTKGLLSTRGVVPACRSLDCVSIFALTAEDANCVFDVAAVWDRQDPYARVNSYQNGPRYFAPSTEGFSFACPLDEQLTFFGDTEGVALFNQAIQQLQDLGGTAVRLDFSPFFAAARLLYEGPWVTERYLATQTLLQQSPEAMLDVTRSIISAGAHKSATDVFNALYQLQAYTQQAKTLMAQVDLALLPTAGRIYRMDEVAQDPIQLNSNLGYYTNFMNLLDFAAVAVPAGFVKSGLPWGITLFANPWQDKYLLSMAQRWQQALQLPLGHTQQPYPNPSRMAQTPQNRVEVVVCGAHLQGLALNWQLVERGGRLECRTQTSPDYRLYALSGGPLPRPALQRVAENGVAIEVEVWSLPIAEFGSFVANIPAPLGIGKVELADGRCLSGFICDHYGLADAKDISELGGWRAYLRWLSD